MSKLGTLKVVDNDKEPNFKDGDGGDSYAIGDTVMLISGGPALTVVGIEEKAVLVAWFADEELNSVQLPLAAVEACELNDD